MEWPGGGRWGQVWNPALWKEDGCVYRSSNSLEHQWFSQLSTSSSFAFWRMSLTSFLSTVVQMRVANFSHITVIGPRMSTRSTVVQSELSTWPTLGQSELSPWPTLGPSEFFSVRDVPFLSNTKSWAWALLVAWLPFFTEETKKRQ